MEKLTKEETKINTAGNEYLQKLFSLLGELQQGESVKIEMKDCPYSLSNMRYIISTKHTGVFRCHERSIGSIKLLYIVKK